MIRKQYGIILIEVLIAIAIIGMLILYIAKIQKEQWEQRAETLTASKITELYQLTTQVMFEPLVKRQNSSDDISSWKVNDTIKALQTKLLSPAVDDNIYVDIQTASSTFTANFFNGAGIAVNGGGLLIAAGPSSCDTAYGVYTDNRRLECGTGFSDVPGNVVKGVMISGQNQRYFSVNHVENTEINQVRPTAVTIFIDGLDSRDQLREMNDLAEAVSAQVSQLGGMSSNSEYAKINIADFSAASYNSYDTGVEAYEVLLNPSLHTISSNMGLAIVFELNAAQVLRNDGMAAIQAERALCWDVNVGASSDVICQSAVTSEDNIDNGITGSGGRSKFIKTNGNLLFQTEDQQTTERVYRTPIEPIVTSFAGGGSVTIPKPVCPTIKRAGVDVHLKPHLSVVPSSFTNSGYGNFPDINDPNYGLNEVTRLGSPSSLAEILSGILFRWSDNGDSWEVNSVVASPNDTGASDGLNLESIQILALRWCEG